jgi:hypothetical protein
MFPASSLLLDEKEISRLADLGQRKLRSKYRARRMETNDHMNFLGESRTERN